MPLDPLQIQLSDGEKLEALKRFRRRYGDELEELETEMRLILTAIAEHDFLVPYVGEQPEVKELLENKEKLAAMEKRRQHIGMLIDRLDQVIPKGQGEDKAANYQRF